MRKHFATIRFAATRLPLKYIAVSTSALAFLMGGAVATASADTTYNYDGTTAANDINNADVQVDNIAKSIVINNGGSSTGAINVINNNGIPAELNSIIFNNNGYTVSGGEITSGSSGNISISSSSSGVPGNNLNLYTGIISSSIVDGAGQKTTLNINNTEGQGNLIGGKVVFSGKNTFTGGTNIYNLAGKYNGSGYAEVASGGS